jgi:RNA polymerase sigma-70 factor (ECF subfamily)
MDLDATESPRPLTDGPWFPTTHWSVVLNAQAVNTPQGAQALEQVCRTYWYPLYAYVRRQGRSADDASDLTQTFFERILAGNGLSTVDQRKGKFRSYLLGAMNHFLAEDWKRARRQKRGGGQPIFSIDEASAEERYRLEPADEMTAERIYERRWALTILEEVLRRLETEFATANRSERFHLLKVFLLGDRGESSYVDTAAQLGLSENAVRVAVHRMRQRYGELFRETIAYTVGEPAEVDSEIAHLRHILGG